MILADFVEPIKGYDSHAGIVYTIAPVEALEVVLDWQIPLTGFGIIETRSTRETQTFLCATTPIDIDATLMRLIVHQKWGIENNGIKDLKDNWHFEHNFYHHHNGSFVILLVLLMV